MSIKEDFGYVFYLGLGGCHYTYVWQGREREKWQDGRKGFLIGWLPAPTNVHCLNCTQLVLSLVRSHQCVPRVSRKMNCIFPLLTTLLLYEGSLTRPSLPRSWQVKEWLELAHVFQTGRSQGEKQQQQRVGVPALQILFIFLDWCPQKLKPTSKRETNEVYVPPYLFNSQEWV